MRRLNSDDGAVAVIVALLALVLFGMSALVIDAGAFYHERRELQNGADAAALAVAAECAAGDCGDYQGTAENYADENAAGSDGFAGVALVCSSATVVADELLDSPPLCLETPPGVDPTADYVHVRTVTDDGAGGDEVPWIFGRVLSDADDGTTVGARATVIWGAPGGLASAIPVTMSECDWKEFTADGSDLAPAPDYDAYPEYGYSASWLGDTAGGRRYERIFYTHSTESEQAGVTGECVDSPVGGTESGNFGWLEPSEECETTTTVSPEGDTGYEGDTGNTVPPECKNSGEWPAPGTLVYIPVYDYLTVKDGDNPGGGSNVWYHVVGYAAFYITGYNLQLPGGTDEKSIVTGQFPCTGSDRCISGFFTAGLAPATGAVGGGPSYGANITQLVG